MCACVSLYRQSACRAVAWEFPKASAIVACRRISSPTIAAAFSAGEWHKRANNLFVSYTANLSYNWAGKPFAYVECWQVVKDLPKWMHEFDQEAYAWKGEKGDEGDGDGGEQGRSTPSIGVLPGVTAPRRSVQSLPYVHATGNFFFTFTRSHMAGGRP